MSIGYMWNLVIDGKLERHYTDGEDAPFRKVATDTLTNSSSHVLDLCKPHTLTFNQTIETRGDTIDKQLLRMDLPELLGGYFSQFPGYPYFFISHISLLIGDQIVNTLTGRQIYIHNQLKSSEERKRIAQYTKSGIIPLDFLDYIPTISLTFSRMEVHISLTNDVALKHMKNYLNTFVRSFHNLLPNDVVHMVEKYSHSNREMEVMLSNHFIFEDHVARKQLIYNTHDQIIIQTPYTEYPICCQDFNLNFTSYLSQLAFVVENPDRPFEFYNAPFKQCQLKVNGHSLSNGLGDPKEWLITDKIMKDYEIPDLPIFTRSWTSIKTLLTKDQLLSCQYDVRLKKPPYEMLNCSKVTTLTLDMIPASHIPPHAKVYVIGKTFNTIRFSEGMASVRYL